MQLIICLLLLAIQTLSITAFAASNACDNNADIMTSAAASKYRSVRTILPRPPSHWVGDGFKVYPVFANKAFTEEVSPLLMFDYAEPKKFPAQAGSPLGVGQHPHRGAVSSEFAFIHQKHRKFYYSSN